MKIFKTHKKLTVSGLALAVALMTGGAAYAWFSATGTGTGSGVVGNAGAFVITSASPSGYLYPDTAGSNANVETTDYTVTNSGGGNAVLNQVDISVANSDGTPWTYTDGSGDPACTAADFSIDGAVPGSPFEDTSQAGTYIGHQAQTGSFTLEMIDNGLNQDSCEGLTVPIYFTTGYPGVVGTDLSGTDLTVLTLDGPPPTLGSAGFYPNSAFNTVPTVTEGTPVSLTVTVIQPAQTPDGTIAVSYNNTYLTFTGTSADGVCGAPVTTGTSSTVTCAYTDLDHVDSSKPFNFNTIAVGSTSATATATVGADTATETFGLTIS